MALKRPRFITNRLPIKLAPENLPGSTKVYWALAIAALAPLTLWGTTQHFNWAMMALITFGLAYAGKGLRKPGVPGQRQKGKR